MGLTLRKRLPLSSEWSLGWGRGEARAEWGRQVTGRDHRVVLSERGFLFQVSGAWAGGGGKLGLSGGAGETGHWERPSGRTLRERLVVVLFQVSLARAEGGGGGGGWEANKVNFPAIFCQPKCLHTHTCTNSLSHTHTLMYAVTSTSQWWTHYSTWHNTSKTENSDMN